jgi:hypothetical protein
MEFHSSLLTNGLTVSSDKETRSEGVYEDGVGFVFVRWVSEGGNGKGMAIKAGPRPGSDPV